MDLSIVIVNFRAWQHLADCLDSLAYLQHCNALSWEIVVVDNHSDDNQLAGFQSRYSWVTWLENMSNSGFASGCNLGAGISTGRQLLFLNPDCVDSQQILPDLYTRLSGSGVISSVRQCGADDAPRKEGGEFPRWWALAGPGRGLRSLLARLPGFPGSIQWLSGSCLMISRQDFEALGGWDTGYWMYSEDVDLCRRAADLGITCQLFTEYQMIHHHGGSSRADAAVSALTRAEVIISKHRYCQRHFSDLQQLLGHLQVFLFRGLPALIAARLARRSRAGLKGLHLREFYAQVRRCRRWQSPRVQQPPDL